MGLIPGWEDPLEEDLAATSVFLLTWRIPWTEAWKATVHRVSKSQLNEGTVTTQDMIWLLLTHNIHCGGKEQVQGFPLGFTFIITPNYPTSLGSKGE